MSCLLCKSGCVHCEAGPLWAEILDIAAICEHPVTNGAEAYGLLDELVGEAYQIMESLDEDGEADSQAHSDEMRDYLRYEGLRDDLKRCIDGKAIYWRDDPSAVSP